MENIENKIKKLRKKKGYTQSFMAEKLGLSIRAYSKIERGETQLTINRLSEIALILDTPLIEMIEENVLKETVSNTEQTDHCNVDVISTKQHYEETIAILKDQIETLKAIIEKVKF